MSIEDLEKLAKLRESGALTEDEFQTKKTEMLSGSAKSPKKKSKIRTFLTVILALWIGWAVISAISKNSAALADYIQPEKAFLSSEVLVRPGISDVGMDVSQFEIMMEKVFLSNGKYQKVNGWVKTANGYSLHLKGLESYSINFNWDGKSALMQPVEIGGQNINPMKYMVAISSSVKK